LPSWGWSFLIMGILAILLAYGFLNGKRWAWFLGVIYGFLSIAFSVISVFGSGGLLDFLTLGFSIVIPVLDTGVSLPAQCEGLVRNPGHTTSA